MSRVISVNQEPFDPRGRTHRRRSIRHSTRLIAATVALLASSLVIVAPASAACTDAPTPGVDWSNCSFTFADLADINVSNGNLRGVDVSYAVFFRANLSGVDLRGATMRDAFLIGADLSGADLTDADLSDADLVGANLNNTVLVRTDLSRSDVDLASVAGASFVSADLSLADFSDVQGASTAVFGRAPVAVADQILTWEGREVTMNLLANDDPNDTNAFADPAAEIFDPPRNGSIRSGTLRYTPRAGFTGTDSFTYRMVDTLQWTNLPGGAVNQFRSPTVTVQIEVRPTIRVGAPYAGTSGIEGEVVRLYVALLRRVPDPAGFRFWVDQRNGGRSLASVARSFEASSEFLDANDDLSTTEFVTLLYHNVLERQPDQGGLSFWVDQIDSGARTRDAAVLSFTESPEFKRQTGTS